MMHLSPTLKGPWTQRMIPNPDYYYDLNPLENIGLIGAVAFEVGEEYKGGEGSLSLFLFLSLMLPHLTLTVSLHYPHALTFSVPWSYFADMDNR